MAKKHPNPASLPEAKAPDPPTATEGQPPGGGKPGRLRGTEDSFTGRSAQLAVMAELMRRRCNAAIPEVDLGLDIFAFRDDREEVARIQVKACTSTRPYEDGSGFSAKFALPLKQLRLLNDQPQLFYALVVQREGRWDDFLIVSRARLQEYFNGEERFGSVDQTNKTLVITVEFRAEVRCSGQTLTDCRNAWEALPRLRPTPDEASLSDLVAIADAPPGPEPSPANPAQG